MKIIKLYILNFILLFFFLISCSEKGKDPYPELNIPVPTGSSDLSIGFDKSIYGKTVSYYVKEKFPALNIQIFYDKFLSNEGFTVLEDYSFTDKTWVKFNKVSLKWDIDADSPPARYFRAWVDSHKNLMFKLTLSYHDTDKLSVTCFLHPYAQHDLFFKFHRWVTKMNKEQEFGDFLTKYRKPDGKMDIERALKENPESELIKKFAKAAEQDKQDIAAAYKAYKETIQNK